MTSTLPKAELRIVDASPMDSCRNCVFDNYGTCTNPNRCTLRARQVYMTPAAALHFLLTGEADHDFVTPKTD